VERAVMAAHRRIDLVADVGGALSHGVMVDQLIHLHLSGFSPAEHVTLRATYAARDGTWKSEATFLVDKSGSVDVAAMAPLSGSYRHADAMGLFWSMKLEANTESPHDNRIELTAAQGGRVRATATIERWFVAPDVKKSEIREQGLFGVLFTPPGDGPHPGLLVLGGSSGGLPELQARMFASHGYAALALAYIRHETLPAELLSIPLEYFKTALDWIKAQKSIRGDQIGVYGISKGGEAALLLGATFPDVKAIVAVVPSAVVWQGLSGVELGGFVAGTRARARAGSRSSWSFRGRDLPFIPFASSAEFAEAMQRALEERTPIALTPHHVYSLACADADTVDKATIRVEQAKAPILLVSGEDDRLWPSSMLSDLIVARLAQHQYAYPYRHLKYPGTGHLMTIPYQPTTTNTGGMAAFRMEFGGDARTQAAAIRDSWTQILEFFEEHLRPAVGRRPAPMSSPERGAEANFVSGDALPSTAAAPRSCDRTQ
jgi:dienelactone hydrolase